MAKDGGKAFVKIVSQESEGVLTYEPNLEKRRHGEAHWSYTFDELEGEIEFKIDPHARLVKAASEEENDCGLFDFKARWNLAGRVAYSTYKFGIGKSGKPWVRKGLVLINNNARITVEGWDNSWPNIYNTLQQGDEVAILNVSLDAWAVDVKAGLEKEVLSI